MTIQLSLIILLLIIYITYCSGYKPKCPKIYIKQLIKNKKFKTGDLLFFRRNGSIVPFFSHTYLSHVALIYINPLDKYYRPQLFEINYLCDLDHINRSHGNQIQLCDLYYRLIAFNGEIYYKELKNTIDKKKVKALNEFLTFAKTNMYYELQTVFMVFARKFFKEPFHFGTNCAELILYCLIKLEIISFSELKNKRINYLRYLTNLRLTETNEYKNFIKIIIFDY